MKDIAAQLRAIADQLDGAAAAEATVWPHGERLWSPPNKDGAVKLKHVETVLVPKYEADLNAIGSKLPREFFIGEALAEIADSDVRDVALMNVSAAGFRQNRSYSYVKKVTPASWPWLSPKVTWEQSLEFPYLAWPSDIASLCKGLEGKAKYFLRVGPGGQGSTKLPREFFGITADDIRGA